MSRGPGTNEEQIQKLRENLSADDVAIAEQLVVEYGHDADIIALAYKLTRSTAKKKLPKSVNDLIEKLPEDEAEELRGRLLKVQG